MQANFDNYCEACYQDLPHRHPRTEPYCHICAVQLGDDSANEVICGDCLSNPPAYDRVISAMHYLPPISALLHAFKDEGQQGCGRLLSACLLRHLQQLDVSAHLPQGLLPVPLHVQRQRQRGFNQAQVIAQHLGSALALPVWHQHCTKTKPTANQQGQNKQQRKTNLSQAFQVNPCFKAINHVAIVDDVVTTGSTVNALAEAIRRVAGADMQISVWCLARTLPPHSQLHLAHWD